MYAVTHSRNLTTKFGNKNFVDLTYLSQNLGPLLAQIKNSDINTVKYFCDKNQELINKLKDIVVDHKTNINNSSGISIYYPRGGNMSYDYNYTYWAQNSWWANFLIHLKQDFERNPEINWGDSHED